MGKNAVGKIMWGGFCCQVGFMVVNFGDSAR